MHTARLFSAFYVAFSLAAASALADPAHPTITARAVLPRQDNQNSNNNNNNSNRNSETTPAETKKDENNTKKEEEPTGGLRGTATGPPTTGSGTNAAKATKAINPLDPAGGVQMLTPGVFDGVQYYKNNEKVTFGFNLTSMIVTPTAINVEAFCSANSAYYTLTQNASAQITKVVWDLAEELATNTVAPLVMTSYALVVYDASKPRDAAPSAGYLAPFRGAQFAIYSPSPSVAMKDFVCTGCSAATAIYNSQSVRVLLFSSIMATLGFAWFVGNGVF